MNVHASSRSWQEFCRSRYSGWLSWKLHHTCKKVVKSFSNLLLRRQLRTALQRACAGLHRRSGSRSASPRTSLLRLLLRLLLPTTQVSRSGGEQWVKIRIEERIQEQKTSVLVAAKFIGALMVSWLNIPRGSTEGPQMSAISC